MSSNNMDYRFGNKGITMKRKGLASLLLPLVAAAVAIGGCNQTGKKIVRVQTNLVDKSIFEGEWWATQTVIDVDADSAGIGAFEGQMSWADLGIDKGQSGSLGRIRWVIDQDYLFAYRSYELIEGGNDDGDEPDFRGQPLAAFAIEDHVDVRKDYSEITGEKTRVTVENTSDARWFERQYMRVDWSQNHVQSFYFLEDVFSLSGQRESAPFDIQETGAHPDFPASWAPQFVRVSEDPDYRFAGEWPADMEGDPVHYMSFVNMYLWSPGEACLLIGGGPCQTYRMPMRLSFLRVPPEHDYAAKTQPHQEYDRFGIIRRYQRTYVRGGQNEESIRQRCESDADCDGARGKCDMERHICVGGLTEDYGETDFLAFYRSRHNFYEDSLTDVECRGDWECNGLFDYAEGQPGSTCDRAAQRCTIPPQDRDIRPVTYHLNAGYPAHLVPAAYRVMGDWNEVFMRGRRAETGDPIPDYSVARQECHNGDPTKYCHCDAPEVAADGTCEGKYDPFVPPSRWAEMGVEAPYDCQVQRPEGWTPPAHPTSFDEYPAPTVYQHEFVGEECMFTLESNSCDLAREDPSESCDAIASRVAEEEVACEASADCGAGLSCTAGTCELDWEQLGDLRYQFFNYIDHPLTFFAGVSMPMTDPKNGELIVSNANMAGWTNEATGTTALEYFPVLRGEVPEDHYLKGENLRGYFDRAGRTEHPVSLATSGTDGYSVEDESRPAIPADLHSVFTSKMEQAMPRIEALRGREGRLNILSDRMRKLAGSPIEKRFVESLGPNGQDLLRQHYGDEMTPEVADPNRSSIDEAMLEEISPFRGNKFGAALNRERRLVDFGRAGYCQVDKALFENRFWDYFAKRFEAGDGEDQRQKNLEAQIRIEQAYTRGVMWHEMGHSVGLAHNFAGSLDRNNYHDAYFDVVLGDRDDPSDDLALPVFEDYDNPELGGNADGAITGDEIIRFRDDLREVRDERARLGAGNTQTASIMDYGGDLSDLIYGLGKYDVAATMYNYFDRVEAYTADPRISSDDSLDGLERSADVDRVWWHYYRGGESCNVSSECPYAQGTELLGDQPVFQRCIQNPRSTRLPTPCDGNDNCVCSSFDDDFLDYRDGVPPYNRDADDDGEVDFWPVDYLYCNDSRVFDISWCSQFDAGESFREIIDHYRRQWTESYPLRYYRRFQRGGAQPGYSVRWIQDAAKIYQHLFFRYFYEPGFSAETGPLGFTDQYYASIDAMNWFIQIVNLPNTGSYECDDATATCTRVGGDMDMPGSDFSMLPGQGYAMWSDYQEGHQGFFRQERAGVFIDKYYATLALALRDWGFNFTVDERFYINFFDLFPVEMTEFYGGLIRDDPNWFAPRIEMGADGAQVQHMSWFRNSCLVDGDYVPCRGSQEEVFPTGPTGDGGMRYALDSTTNELLRDWGTILALAQFPVYYDTSFEQRLAIFKKDNGDGHTIPEVMEDGNPACAYGTVAVDPATHDTGCTSEEADYVVYQSDRFHTPYVAVKIQPRLAYNLEEEQLGFQLLARMLDNQDRVRELEALASPTAAEQEELETRRTQLRKNESYLEFLIDIQRTYGISSSYF